MGNICRAFRKYFSTSMLAKNEAAEHGVLRGARCGAHLPYGGWVG